MRVVVFAVLMLAAVSGRESGIPTASAHSASIGHPPDLVCSSWSIAANPDLSGTPEAALQGVIALSPTNAWAVGYNFPFSAPNQQTLIEHYDGTAWHIFPSPNVASVNNALNGIAAVSPTDIWAVGYSEQTPLQTLIEHFDGTSWSIVPSPSTTKESVLLGVAAIAAHDIWAVGISPLGAQGAPLAEHWDGMSWSLVPTPAFAPTYGFTNVSAVSSDNVWAAGQGIQHWNGKNWGLGLNPPAADVYDGVAALAASDVWAVGIDSSASLSAHWNGTAWAVVPAAGSGLFAVAAIPRSKLPPWAPGPTPGGGTHLWAVGTYAGAQGYASATLVEWWDGFRWRIVPSANVHSLSPDITSDYLQSVAAAAPDSAWAVGLYTDSSTLLSLPIIEQYTAQPCAVAGARRG